MGHRAGNRRDGTAQVTPQCASLRRRHKSRGGRLSCGGCGLVRSGTNELKIEITNLWANRLVGDAKLPREKRVTRITQKVPIAGPHESGLLGPVLVRVAKSPP